MFSSILEQYCWDIYKDFPYNSGKHHIYVIFNYERDNPQWVGFIMVQKTPKGQFLIYTKENKSEKG